MLSFAAIILAVIFSYLTPQVVRITVDSIIGNEPFALPDFLVKIIEDAGGRNFLAESLILCAVVSFLLSITAALCDFASRRFLAISSEGILNSLRDTLFEHIQLLPYRWHNDHQTGDIIQRCTMDVEVIKNFFTEHLQALVRTVFLILVALILMFSMNTFMSVIALIFIPITLIYSIIFYRLIGDNFKLADECEGELNSIAQENLTGVNVVRAFGRGRYEYERFEKKNEEFANHWIRLGVLMGLNWGIGDLIGFVQIVVIIVVGSFLAVAGTITLGDFITFVYYNSMLVWPIRQLGRILSELSKSSVSAVRIFDILDAEREPTCKNPKTTDMSGDIEFKDVNFCYREHTHAVSNINFRLEGGKTLGILGSTGSGKSTLMYLLDRLYELPEGSGSITIGGVSINDMDIHYLRKNIGIVLQEPFLFSKTFRENISDGADTGDIESIREYSRIAVIDDSILGFAHGYDTVIGERGVTISGGQRQRVAIARMLMQNTPIKIFDDSLSAVDMETDAKIRKAINERVKGTTIIITHRIATVMNADIILVMDNGQIVETGSHKKLKDSGGIYSRIFKGQSAQEED